MEVVRRRRRRSRCDEGKPFRLKHKIQRTSEKKTKTYICEKKHYKVFVAKETNDKIRKMNEI